MSEQNNHNTTFTLDGREAVAGPNETVLTVARRSGIDIPTLCYHDALPTYGACRLCVVELRAGTRRKMVTSCIYVPHNGDIVETDNPRVRQLRKVLLELLLKRCPNVERLQQLAAAYGVEAPPPDTDDDESRDGSRCILCGLCVRVCATAVRRHAIGVAGRGPRRHISAPLEKSSETCIGCGACAFVCPTGALHLDGDGERRRHRELGTDLAMAACPMCRRPFATESQLDVVRDAAPAVAATVGLCPACRRRRFQDAGDVTLMMTANN